MKKISLSILGFALAVLSMAQTPEDLKVKTFTLSNGMTVWINEDHSQPKAFGAVVVKAGARDCPGTGIAHYFEHMMFKGTEKIGTIDYAAEKPYLDSIADMYDRLAIAEDDSVRADIQMEINRLNIAASEYAIPNEFNNLISACGGSGLNAYTSMDITCYHNEFISAYFDQWAELCSERLIDPVFRLFQSELETVYEEKNRDDNQEISAFSDLITMEGYKDSPYQYSVLGTTANLKNPQLSQMSEFFRKYYVAGNMGLMLTGDIDSEKARPVLERTFGRIPAGEAPASEPFSVKQFQGREEVEALVKIPIVKLDALCYRAPSTKDDDCLPLSFLAFMLNNSEGTGLLDKLMTDKKVMAAICLYPNLTFEDAGLFPILFMPRLLFQSNRKAEAKVTAILDDIRSGNIDDAFFNNCKLTYKRNLISNFESIGSRMSEMVSAFSDGRSWEEVLAQVSMIDALTKEELVSIVNRYIGKDYLVVTKKFGDPEKDNLQKPPYKKVVPSHSACSSAYADAIRSAASKVVLPKPVVDFDKDASRSGISDNIDLYTVPNRLNDVFNLSVRYPVGTNEYPNLERVSSYVDLVGSAGMSYDEHRAALQALGSTFNTSAGPTMFTINVTGFDDKLDETLALVGELLSAPARDNSKLGIIRQGEMTDRLVGRRTASTILGALSEYVVYGKKSDYLVDKGKLTYGALMDTYSKLRAYECDVTYSGTLPDETVRVSVAKNLGLGQCTVQHPFAVNCDIVLESGPKVLFVNKKKASQSNICAIVPSELLTDIPSRAMAGAYGEYMGGGMGSVLFQEIREFRSMAYTASASFRKCLYCNRDRIPSYFQANVGTQCDKTIEAMDVIDSLIQNLPVSQNRLEMVRNDMWCDRVTSYPDFREMGDYISNQKRYGFETSPGLQLYDFYENLSMENLSKFWTENVKGRGIVWLVVGDAEKIDMDALSKFGPVTEIKAREIM